MQKQDIAWCPGCGDYPIRTALEKVLRMLPVPQRNIVLTSGIGQAAKMPHYLPCSYFNGLHGRSLPLAVGIKLARPDLTVIAVSGDGCHYGEGGNHFLHTIRRRLDITILVCDNKVYGLTKGQSSPTTDLGVKNALDPRGNENTPLIPPALAIVGGAPFVARTFAGDPQHMEKVFREAILFRGPSVVDILQPCVSFNKANTYAWYRERVYRLEEPPKDRYEALRLAETWGERIPIGIFWRDEQFVCRQGREIFRKPVTEEAVARLLNTPCIMMR
ncbi:MAG: 2-oxoglutarate oxidoreductase subunit KorB [Syntrophaceae bacterium PtaB.Bin038]|nr:MAG: 2-oxoglutarate oxidoreductase subunit KorB [Syntrophaceae bacterium PtaB.Bin038]